MAEEFHLHWQFRPAENPRGAVVIVHGIAEHCGRYEHVVPALNAAGFNVYAYDLRGHGRSPGRRGHIRSWSEYRDDLDAFLRFVRRQESDPGPTFPFFLFGHSMGALIVLDFLLHDPDTVRAAVVNGTPIQPAEVASPFLIFVAKMLSRVWPTFTLPLGIKPSFLSRDGDVVRDAMRDPLCHYRVSARWGTEILATIEHVKVRASGLRTPLMITHGGADRINSPDGSRWLYGRISSGEKKLAVYDGAFHEVHNDLCREQFAADVAAWLKCRAEPA